VVYCRKISHTSHSPPCFSLIFSLTPFLLIIFLICEFALVSDAIKMVGEKCHSVKLVYPFNNYGLYLPPTDNTGGVWLHYEDPLNYYHIESRVCISSFFSFTLLIYYNYHDLWAYISAFLVAGRWERRMSHGAKLFSARITNRSTIL
jgi:hypothetical protein